MAISKIEECPIYIERQKNFDKALALIEPITKEITEDKTPLDISIETGYQGA